MSQEFDIYKDTCLHAGILADRAISDKFPNIEDDKGTCSDLTRWLENRLEREFRDSEAFREKLKACWNSSDDHGDANQVRDWLAKELLPSWLPNSLAEIKAAAIVHRFDYAPDDLQKAASQGGDEDWLVELPPTMDEYGLPFWIEALDSTREPKRLAHPKKPGWQLIVGCH